MKKIKKIFKQSWILIKYGYYKIYCLIHKKKRMEYDNCWLISEHGNDAQDNGYFFFKYLRDNHSNIDARYIITKESSDFNKINSLGKYIIFGSKEHFIAYISSLLLISSHIEGCSPDAGLFYRLQRYGLLKHKGKNVFLQHGVIKDYLPFLNPKATKLSMFVTSAKDEYEYIINKNGYTSDVVKCTGLARFDYLNTKKTNQILVMPTFRIYMLDINENDFIKSDYYNSYNSLINNKDIIKLLEENDLKLVFYQHYQFQKYNHLFKSNSPRIKIATFDSDNVHDLLNDSLLLITDYSSVYFDFAYMGKPVIYYQFDNDIYRKNHYIEGYFSYEKNGFGPVVDKEKDLVKSIRNVIDKDFKLDKKTLDKINDFFSIRDNNNCKRIYSEIEKIIKKGNK